MGLQKEQGTHGGSELVLLFFPIANQTLIESTYNLYINLHPTTILL